MNLIKAGGTIGGLTLVSRILGFVREMIFARIMGAGMAADAFTLAFLIPNLFRRLFGEGAFSQGFVPLFARRLDGEGGMAEARRFAEEVQAVFLPLLILVTILFMIAMPAFVAVIAAGWRDDPEKFGLAVDLTRITFPYLIFISMVSLFSGVLNSLTRFAAAAFAPALLNVALITALLVVPSGGQQSAYALAWAVIAGGVVQLALLILATKRAGLTLKLLPPRMTPRVKELFVLILPATLGAGGYYLSQLFYAYFATTLPEGSLVYLSQADRLNQLPLALVGSALGTAILPAISRRIGAGEDRQAANIQGRATELAMLLAIPAAVALSVASGPIMTVLFEGGRFTAADAAISALVLSILVAGLPAYVMIKVLAPGFFARKDMWTPLWVTIGSLAVGVSANFVLVPAIGIAALAATTAGAAWINAIALYAILVRRGFFRFESWLVVRLVKQLLAAGVMAAAILFVQSAFAGSFDGSAGQRLVAITAVVAAGAAVYFVIAWFSGAMDREDLLILLRRKKVNQ
ncbi:MAG TPA: murein biosynthesis integral membrane protein MurJ [Sphingomicrobium sp.]|nr:murein biosynthesis integral membrane protein MurJ [Sphingomicrobium sp.]